MDKNTLTGFVLIGAILLMMQYINQPTQEQVDEQQRLQDSLKNEQLLLDTDKKENPAEVKTFQEELSTLSDSAKQALASSEFGAFSNAVTGKSEIIKLENDLFIVELNTQGGAISGVELKKHKKIAQNDKGEQIKIPVRLLDDEKNKFEYILPVNSKRRNISTSELIFKPVKVSETEAVLRASAGEGKYIEQHYKIEPGKYMVDYDVKLVGLSSVLAPATDKITLNWVNYLDKLEKSVSYERNYSSVFYKMVDEDLDYCSCTGDDEIKLEQQVQWLSHSQQFFNTSLVAKNNFKSAEAATAMLDKDSDNLKKLISKATIAIDNPSSQTIEMDFYLGPNDYDILAAYEVGLEEIIPFGWGIFRAVNKWIIRPMFKFLSSFIGSAGIVILLLTFIVKLLVFPLTYKMLYSQAKMAALKPQLEVLKKKVGDDAQAMQVKQMELYRETGVNPLGGCWPMALQMPLWYALFRFFPASIDFRQVSFLWADDLSSYDSILDFGYIPIIGDIYGDHVSLFTILWAVTTVIYAWYNTQNMSMPTGGGANMKMMQSIQYVMPVMFLFFFNSFASGLTCYMLFSSVFNIGQTVITKGFIINKKKVAEELEANKKKPKKKGGFGQKLQDAMAQQQKIQEQQKAEKAKGSKARRNKK